MISRKLKTWKSVMKMKISWYTINFLYTTRYFARLETFNPKNIYKENLHCEWRDEGKKWEKLYFLSLYYINLKGVYFMSVKLIIILENNWKFMQNLVRMRVIFFYFNSNSFIWSKDEKKNAKISEKNLFNKLEEFEVFFCHQICCYFLRVVFHWEQKQGE